MPPFSFLALIIWIVFLLLSGTHSIITKVLLFMDFFNAILGDLSPFLFLNSEEVSILSRVSFQFLPYIKAPLYYLADNKAVLFEFIWCALL